MKVQSLTVLLLAAAVALAASAQHPTQLSAEQQAKIADIATTVLHETGVPSASIAIATGDHLRYAHAFGLANVAEQTAATASMAYPIGSISKQFTAQAVLLLQQRGKLSIDDPVAKYFPNFTRAQDVTLRNLVTMTSGYEDFAPQDYIIPAWRTNVDPLSNATEWATKPLDFDPGTKWQYSNTNYVILALIVQKVSGQPLMTFLRNNVLDPLHLQGVFDTYTQRDKLQVLGYVSNAMAPVRVQPLEGTGWYFGDGALSMPASTLVDWDLGIIGQKLLSPASYQQFETSFVLKDGTPANYGLGTFVREVNGHRMLEHSGEVGGYVAENVVLPDDGLVIVVLTNQVASSAATKIAHEVSVMLLPQLQANASQASASTTVADLLRDLQKGTVDRSRLTPDTNDYFNANTLADFRSTLAPLGPLQNVTRTATAQRGGMTFGRYKATFTHGAVIVSTYLTKAGKFEQFLVTGKA